jgi:hypothetical protein
VKKGNLKKLYKNYSHNISIAASWADIHILSIILLPIIGYWLDRLLISFVVIRKNRFFNDHQHPSDTASNTQPAAMLCVGGNFKGRFNNLTQR